MERSRCEIDEYVRRLDRGRMNSEQAMLLARDLRAMAWHDFILLPMRRRFGALFGPVAAEAMPGAGEDRGAR